MNVKVNQSNDQILSITSTLYHLLLENNANKEAKKALDLIEKIQTETFVIGFAGHFSAGKSTMINTLLQEAILPSSPIPTSANLVKVKKGRGLARVSFVEGNPIEIAEPYDMDTLKSLCVDGDAIREIELEKAATMLPKGVIIMDTPGIDSSNDADRIMTESALHIVDVLFYVMDYNHVQSEVNLAFLTEMQHKGKPLYIVINQIDKHQSKELTFEAFQQSVYDSFHEWGIKPTKVYFTSLKQLHHPENQYEALQQEIHQLMDAKLQYVYQTVKDACVTITEEHLKQQTEYVQEEIASLQLEAEQLNVTFEGSSSDMYNEMNELEQLATVSEQEMLQQIQSTLHNAYIMPYETREKARLWVESMQADFKIGILFTKKKTEDERQIRLQQFYQELMEKVTANLQWPVRNKLVETAKQFKVLNESVLQPMQSLTISFEPEDVKALLKTGAGSGGDYILHFTQDVATEVKRRYKQQAIHYWQQVKNVLEKRTETEIDTYKAQSNELQKQEEITTTIQHWEQMMTKQKKSLQSVLAGELVHQNSIEEAMQALIARDNRVQQVESLDAYMKEDKPNTTVEQTEKQSKDVDAQISAKHAINVLQRTHSLLDDMHGFNSVRKHLLEKKQRIETKHFTVALFGAFSAGKSSFANALLGDDILPVSPNPTTAAINKISPSNQQFAHGTVEVKVKSVEHLIEDIQYAVAPIQLQSTSLTGLVEEISQLQHTKQLREIDQKRLSFIRAMVAGFEDMKEHVGDTITINMDQFASYVADETKSCFVEWLHLYYDCPLTEQGITIVDTPGADSVNARHTEVSFEYIKQADAILFVTYYNHAFSGADKDFLMQLGRVKDAFSLDKMFFIINAADLAETEADLKLVTNYMQEQLTKFGIRNPRLYAMSSLMAMKEKQGLPLKSHPVLPSSGIKTFEGDFYPYMKEDLTGLLTQEAMYDVHRVKDRIDQMMKSASLDKSEKDKKREKLREQTEIMKQITSQLDTSRYHQVVEQKIEKQTYYVAERMGLRFGDFFKEHINPSTVMGKGAQGKEQLQRAIEQLINHIGHELMQEIRAVSLRIESFLHLYSSEVLLELQHHLHQINEDLALAHPVNQTYITPEIEQPFNDFPLTLFKEELQRYKNQKEFFEGNDKDKVRDSMQVKMKERIELYMKEQTTMLTKYYGPQWDESLNELQKQTIATIQEYEEGMLYSLQEGIEIEKVKQKQIQLRKIYQETT
ncbi:dynamin family protein [Pontibacillus litoralis]|uniref:Dynamin n=1 Tax=Pontibacillus litoralis JSM 072002 TaxID=1385512 RepID=A0A0A5G0J2_9BACI|nr:dynamin family protein [Pontibacillus litoralis]KGX84623.1 dynamin [Pontibacillus litoralis JSM 072002]